jgi:hypothetical protein
MYLEFLFVIVFYYTTLSRRDVLLEIGIPAILAVGYYMYGTTNNSTGILVDSIMFLRLLLGFSMASLALFLTKNDNLGETKKYMTERKLLGKAVSLYKYIVLSFTYLVIMLCLIQTAYLLFRMFSIDINSLIVSILKSIYVFFLFHVVFATIRAITETYQVLSKQK